MGPFYCPTDQGIYLDTSFFDELANRFGATGDFAQDYVIAHEFGHHIQNLLGTSDQVRAAAARPSEAEGNAMSVKLELQADCYAGVWAAQNRDRMDPGDLEEGMTAAQAIGDDTLQKETQGRVVPDSFTHGTSAQRMAWLKRGHRHAAIRRSAIRSAGRFSRQSSRARSSDRVSERIRSGWRAQAESCVASGSHCAAVRRSYLR